MRRGKYNSDIAKRFTMVNYQKIFLAFLIFISVTTFSFAVDREGRNFLLLGGSLISFIVAVLQKSFFKVLDFPSFCAVAFYLITVAIHNNGSLDLGNIYTLVFYLFYVSFIAIVQSSNVRRITSLIFLRRLIFVFTGFALLQAVMDLFGFWIPNKVIYEGIGRQNSLSFEPSHFSRIILLLSVVYFTLKNYRSSAIFNSYRRFFSTEKLLCISILICIFLAGSTLGFLAVVLFALIMVRRSTIFNFLVIIIVFTFGEMFFESLALFNRAFTFVKVFTSMDLLSIISADHSAAIRVIPSFLFFENLDLTNAATWFGAGENGINDLVVGNIVGAQGSEEYLVGFFPGIFISSGIIGGVIFIYGFVIRYFSKETSSIILAWFVLLVTSALNSQLFWVGLVSIKACSVLIKKWTLEGRVGTKLSRRNG